MQIPNADRAIIDEAKIRDYLLSSAHPIGRFKSVFFHSMGYTQADWQQLAEDLREQHLCQAARLAEQSPYGQKYEITAAIKGPSGRIGQVVSVWIIVDGEDSPRLVTAFPGAE